MKSRTPLKVEVIRGTMVESVHDVMVTVIDERGIVMGFCGNVDYLVYPRSAIKMLQAIPFVESGALDKFGLDDRHIALACSSHRGEKTHLTLASQWLEKLKIVESLLHCGPAMPTHEPTAHDMIRRNVPPHPLINNCSGKHLGIISSSLALNENPMGYAKYEHSAQVRLRKVLTEMMRIDLNRMPWAVDGCGIPTISVPLQAVAMGMAQLMKPPAGSNRKLYLQKIVEACRAQPLLLSGTDDFVTVVNEKTQGRCLVKNGAEGIFTGMIPEKGFAFALKVVDGTKRAGEVAAAHLLHAYGGIKDSEWNEMKPWVNPEVKNSRGEKVGEIRVAKGL